MINKVNSKIQYSVTIALGGPVLEITRMPQGPLFMASPAGVLRQKSGGWQLLMRGVPFWRINTVTAAEDTIFLAGLPNGIVRSFDQGQLWHRCFVDQPDSPVAKIVASPNFSTDRVLLAGTDGDGILRSTDGGRHWQLSNFGLRDFHILDMAVAPEWGSRYERVFAISEHSIYQSPNGGRAWRRADCEAEIRPSALAVSPNFADDQTVMAGTEAGQLYCSTDGGRSWKLFADGFEMINGLCFNDETLFVGTLSSVVKLSLGKSELRTDCLTSSQPLLNLFNLEGTLYASFVDGVRYSIDNGTKWHAITDYAARRFVWVQAVGQKMVAAGPEVGIWFSADGGHSWSLIWAAAVVLAVDFSANGIMVSCESGIFVSTDEGQSWTQAAVFEMPAIAVTLRDSGRWFGFQNGAVCHFDGSQSAGDTRMPFGDCQLLEMQWLADILYTSVWQPARGEIELWQFDAERERWFLIMSQPGQPIKPVLAFEEGLGLLIGIANKLYFQRAGQWQAVKVGDPDAPITAVYPRSGSLFVGSTDQLFELDTADLTQQAPLNWTGGPILALIPLPQNGFETLVATVNGDIYFVQ